MSVAGVLALGWNHLSPPRVDAPASPLDDPLDTPPLGGRTRRLENQCLARHPGAARRAPPFDPRRVNSQHHRAATTHPRIRTQSPRSGRGRHRDDVGARDRPDQRPYPRVQRAGPSPHLQPSLVSKIYIETVPDERASPMQAIPERSDLVDALEAAVWSSLQSWRTKQRAPKGPLFSICHPFPVSGV